MIPKRRPKKLKLGTRYLVRFKWGNIVRGKLIQPTKCGFNLLNEETNKCILTHHLYPSKCENHLSETWFFINETIDIREFK